VLACAMLYCTARGTCHVLLSSLWPMVTAALPTTHMQVLRRFGAFQRIQLQPPLPVEGLAVAALEAQEVLGHWQVRASASRPLVKPQWRCVAADEACFIMLCCWRRFCAVLCPCQPLGAAASEAAVAVCSCTRWSALACNRQFPASILHALQAHTRTGTHSHRHALAQACSAGYSLTHCKQTPAGTSAGLC
jgi:hypothetical protein